MIGLLRHNLSTFAGWLSGIAALHSTRNGPWHAFKSYHSLVGVRFSPVAAKMERNANQSHFLSSTPNPWNPWLNVDPRMRASLVVGPDLVGELGNLTLRIQNVGLWINTPTDSTNQSRITNGKRSYAGELGRRGLPIKTQTFKWDIRVHVLQQTHLLWQK